jgi:hypothetical protein
MKRTTIPTNIEETKVLFETFLSIFPNCTYDEKTLQRTVIYDKFAKIVLVSCISDHHQIIENYNDIPELKLTKEQLHTIQEKVKVAYDGNHILIKDIQYCEKENTIFIEAVRLKFSTLRALNTGVISFHDFPLYRTGVISPLITSDRKIIFIQRQNDQLFSAPGGFLEPLTEKDDLVLLLNHQKLDFIRGNALKELQEEVFDDLEHFQQLSFTSNFGISMRYTHNNSLPVMEFIQPIKLQYSSHELIVVLNENNSKDCIEHTKNYWIFDFSSKIKLMESLKEIGSKSKPGYFLYLPMIETILPTLKGKIRATLSPSV